MVVPPPRAHQPRATIPGWRLILSDAGRLWASRERPFSLAALHAGAERTVDADSLEALRAETDRQETIAREAEEQAAREQEARRRRTRRSGRTGTRIGDAGAGAGRAGDLMIRRRPDPPPRPPPRRPGRHLPVPHYTWDHEARAEAAMLEITWPGWAVLYGTGSRLFHAIATWPTPEPLLLCDRTIDGSQGPDARGRDDRVLHRWALTSSSVSIGHF